MWISLCWAAAARAFLWRCAPYYSRYILNTEELKIELDRMLIEAGVTSYLHTKYVAPCMEDGELKAVIIENRLGRSAIRAKFFIDATVDGFLGADCGMETYYHDAHFQPATTGARVWGWKQLTDPNTVLRSEENRRRIGGRAGWEIPMPGATEISVWCKSQPDVLADSLPLHAAGEDRQSADLRPGD